jgi:hydroxyethylthiazole kinase-like uncharacterized protein yjeF
VGRSIGGQLRAGRGERVRSLSVEEARALDARAERELGLGQLVLMESAALGATHECLDLIPDGASVWLLCGGGHNGGDGLAMARQLLVRGRRPVVELWAEEARLSEATAAQLRAARGLGVEVRVSPPQEPWAPKGASPLAVVDALLGTGARGGLRPWMAERLGQVAESCAGVPVLALDGPSGLDLATGAASPGTLAAVRTLTFAAPKPGLLAGDGPALAGELRVVPIGVPLEWGQARPGSRGRGLGSCGPAGRPEA